MYKKLLMLGVLLTLFTPTANAQLGIKLEDKTNTYSIEAGKTLEIDVSFSNAYSLPTKVMIYTVDGSSTSTGSISAKQYDDERLFFGKWAKLDIEQETLNYNEKKQAKLTISIPENATPGDYPGAIIISKIAEQENTDGSENNQNTGAGIKFATRIAKIILINVPGEKITNVEIEDLIHTNPYSNQHKLNTNIKNTGNTTVLFKLNTEITSTITNEQKSLPESKFKLYPGTSSNGEVSLGKLPLFNFYKVKQKIDYFEHNILTGEDTFIKSVEKEIEFKIIPWNYIFIGIGIILLLITVIITKKTLHKKLLNRCKSYTVKEGDTLAKLAVLGEIKWKKLAKINNIKPPYELKTGTKILLPTKK